MEVKVKVLYAKANREKNGKEGTTNRPILLAVSISL